MNMVTTPGADTLNADVAKLTRLRLDAMPLPHIHDDDDKHDRGLVLVIGGSVHVPGAILLSGTAALRAGAGKLQLATVRSTALSVGLTVPEALVIGLPQTPRGEIDGAGAIKVLRSRIANANAIVVGPGMINEASGIALIRRLVPHVNKNCMVILDSAAIQALSADEQLAESLQGNVIVTPHAGEMASLLEIPVEEVRANAAEVAQHCAERFRVVVVLKGGETFIAGPTGQRLQYRDGKAGLATSGSGDVLAGIIGGLAARGADAMTAAAWGVWVHGSAGNKLARSVGKVGFLARELLPEIPRLVND